MHISSHSTNLIHYIKLIMLIEKYHSLKPAMFETMSLEHHIKSRTSQPIETKTKIEI